MHKNEPIRCYGFVVGYYCSCTHILRNAKHHTISSWLGGEEIKETPVCQKPRGDEDFIIPKRLLCTSKNATDNEPMSLRFSNH